MIENTNKSEKKGRKKSNFPAQDVMVQWNNQEGCDRSYHVFIEGELGNNFQIVTREKLTFYF